MGIPGGRVQEGGSERAIRWLQAWNPMWHSAEQSRKVFTVRKLLPLQLTLHRVLQMYGPYSQSTCPVGHRGKARPYRGHS